MDCEAVNAKVCVVCGASVKANACVLCGTWFCCQHRDHDCPTSKTEGRATRRDADLGQVREELEKGISGDPPSERSRHKPVIKVDAPGVWEPGAGLQLWLDAGDDEAWKGRRPGGSKFLSGARAEETPAADSGGSRFLGVPMSRDGSRPRS